MEKPALVLNKELLSKKLLKRMGFTTDFLEYFEGYSVADGRMSMHEICWEILARTYQLRMLRRELMSEKLRLIRSVEHRYGMAVKHIEEDICYVENVLRDYVGPVFLRGVNRQFREQVFKDKEFVDKVLSKKVIPDDVDVAGVIRKLARE